MTGPVTSPGLARFAPGEWRTFAAFLRHPALPERMTGIRLAAIGKVLQLFALDLVLMALLLGLIQLATALGFSIPENAIDKLKLTPLLLALMIVAAADGRRDGLPQLAVGPRRACDRRGDPDRGRSPCRSFPGRRRTRSCCLAASQSPRWWRSASRSGCASDPRCRSSPSLRVVLFRQRAGFRRRASDELHATASPLALLPLVVPQLIAGLIFGYARVTFGLWSDMLLHMMHNGLLVALIVLSKGM